MIKKKSIIVTGSDGFLGRKLVEKLKKNNTVYGIDIKSKFTKSINIDLTNKKKLLNSFKNKKIDYIFHFGGISDIDFSVKNPDKTLKINIFSLINILNLALEKKINTIVFASSIYTYSNQGSFYKISKLACEEILYEFNRLYNLDYKIIRYGTVFGHDPDHKNSISKMVQQSRTTRKIVREGNGNELRKFIHIDDAINLTIKTISKKYSKFHYFDITGKKNYSIKNIVNKIKNNVPGIDALFTNHKNFHHYFSSPHNQVKHKIKKLSPRIENIDNHIRDLIKIN